MATTSRPRRPMVTARLTLQLLESAALRSECSSPTAGFNNSSSSSDSTSTVVTKRKIAFLQRALHETTAAASPPTHGPSHATKASSVSPMNTSDRPTSETTVSTATSTSSSEDSSLGSWDDTEDDEEEEEEEEQDRGRQGAAATTFSRLSREESVPHHEEVAQGAGFRRQRFFDERNESTALDEFDHPALAGTAAALHGYVVSEGDPVFLEKAYEIARGVAGSKHSLDVTFDACRMALAVGYVHTLTKGASDMANSFAKEHSLCKLAESLKPYWSRSPAPLSPEAMVEWEECMSSLLEVASSVALMTGARDVLSVLDVEAYSNVTEAIGAYLTRRPSVLKQYQDVGGSCLRQHLLGPRMRDHADSE